MLNQMKEPIDDSNTVGKIIQKHYPLIKRTQQPQLKSTLDGRTDKSKALQNSCIEVAYHRMVTIVKTLYLKPEETYFERSYKREESQNFLVMHQLMTSDCYLSLECDFDYDLQVEYAFDNCPFETQIENLLASMLVGRPAKPQEFLPSFKFYYSRMLKIHDSRFVHTLKMR